jgi:O-antigen/teichoic acid export membrane protein
MISGSTAIAQLAGAFAAPILARIYTPADFGVLALFMSLLALINAVNSLRFEFAIPVAKGDAISFLTGLAGLAALAITAVVMCVTIGLGGAGVWSAMKAPQLHQFGWLVPLAALAIGLNQLLTSWAVREHAYKLIARTRLMRAIYQLAAQFSIPLIYPGPVGLLVGYVLGQAGGSVPLVSLVVSRRWRLSARTLPSRVWRAARRYRRFPLFSMPAGLLNTAGVQVPTFLLAAYYGTQVVGWFGLTQRLIGIPVVLIGQSVAQVYFGNAAKLYREQPAALRGFFEKTARGLTMMAIAPTIVLLLAGRQIFGLVLGSSWVEAGHYAQALSVVMLGQLVVTPLSQTFNIVERQDLSMVWSAARLILVCAPLVYCGLTGRAPIVAMWGFAAGSCASYWLLFRMIKRVLAGSSVTAAAHRLGAETA